jgi:hypothetical protein
VQIVPENAAAAKKVLRGAGVPFTMQDVAVVPLRNRPGALAEVAAGLAKAGVNINYIYATACTGGPGCSCYAIISAPNLKTVEAAAKRLK